MVVQSRYCAPQEGQGSYTSVLESERNAISESDCAISRLTNRRASLRSTICPEEEDEASREVTHR